VTPGENALKITVGREKRAWYYSLDGPPERATPPHLHRGKRGGKNLCKRKKGTGTKKREEKKDLFGL